jgi:hypothetical protein
MAEDVGMTDETASAEATSESSPKAYRVEIAVAATQDEVWAAMTEPAAIGQWFGWDYPGIDAEIQQIFVDEATPSSGERMSWSDGSYLEVTGDGTHSVVRAVRDGEGTGDGYDPMEEGWRAFLSQLRHFVEDGPVGARRTIYLTGTTTGADALAAAGDGRTVQDSDRLRAFVDHEGHLIVVAAEAALHSGETGGVSITVSTYGLDDESFGALRDQWVNRWLPVAKDAEVTAGHVPADPA